MTVGSSPRRQQHESGRDDDHTDDIEINAGPHHLRQGDVTGAEHDGIARGGDRQHESGGRRQSHRCGEEKWGKIRTDGERPGDRQERRGGGGGMMWVAESTSVLHTFLPIWRGRAAATVTGPSTGGFVMKLIRIAAVFLALAAAGTFAVEVGAESSAVNPKAVATSNAPAVAQLKQTDRQQTDIPALSRQTRFKAPARVPAGQLLYLQKAGERD